MSEIDTIFKLLNNAINQNRRAYIIVDKKRKIKLTKENIDHYHNIFKKLKKIDVDFEIKF